MKFSEVLQLFLQRINFFEAKRTVDYVCGNGEALPLPLSSEEESRTLKAMEEGEEEEDTGSREKERRGEHRGGTPCFYIKFTLGWPS